MALHRLDTPRVIDPLEIPQEASTTVVAIAVGPAVLLTVAEVAIYIP